MQKMKEKSSTGYSKCDICILLDESILGDKMNSGIGRINFY